MKTLNLLVVILTIFISSVSAKATEPSEPNSSTSNQVMAEYNNAQFLVEVARDGHSNMVSDFLWLINHSIYEVSIKNWNKFVKNYNTFLKAKRAYCQGWSIEFDDILG